MVDFSIHYIFRYISINIIVKFANRNIIDIIGMALISFLSTLTFFSCNDELDYPSSITNRISFLVLTSSDSEWIDTRGTQSVADESDIIDMNVSEGQCETYETPLYLHTLVTKWVANGHRLGNTTTTRGSLVSDVSEYDAFKLYAFSFDDVITDINNPNFIDGDRVIKSGDVWTSERYWPSNKCKVMFFGIAPYENKNANIDFPNITYTVPTSYSDQKDILVCKSVAIDVNPPMESMPQPLTMKHALTSVRFVIDNGQDKNGNYKQFEAGTIKSVVLKNIYNRDTYNLYEQKWTKNYGPLESFSLPNIDYTTTGTTVEDPNLTGINTAFLMIPQELNENAQAEIEFVDNKTGMTHTLVVGLGSRWIAGTEVTYCLSTNKEMIVPTYKIVSIDDNKSYAFENIEDFFNDVNYKGVDKNFIVHSYADIFINGERSRQAVPFEINVPSSVRYDLEPEANNSESQWISITENNSLLDNIEGDKTGLYGYRYYVPELQGKPNKELSQHDKDLQVDPVIGTFNLANPNNPSDYKIVPNNGCSTANCYIVNRPGTYCFPIVYGNAIVNGNVNEHSFKTNVTRSKSGYEVLQSLQNHCGNITSPKIQDNKDNAGNYIVPTKGKVIWTDKQNLVSNINIELMADTWYLKFETLPKNQITQGNAIIAVLDEDENVLWSWHIWVTSYKLNTNLVNVSGSEFMPLNIGWVYGSKMTYDDRRTIEPITITMGVKTKSITIFHDKIDAESQGHNTLYQWGRKDPFPGGQWINSMAVDEIVSGGEFKYADPPNKTSIAESYQQSVKNPGTMYVSSALSSWNTYKGGGTTKVQCLNNAWDIDRNTSGSTFSLATYKTVYDPCPVGFRVPSANEFAYFKDDVFVYVSNLDEIQSQSFNIGFPLSGYRSGSDGIYHVSKNNNNIHISQCYTSTIQSNKQAYHLCLWTDGTKHMPHYENSKMMDAMSIRPVKE